MFKIGITGSIASGKTTASQIISRRRGALFSADKVVRNLYKKNSFKKIISKKLGIDYNLKFKNELKKKILEKKENIKKLEKLIHPIVRKEMFIFFKKNKRKRILFFEVPLLIENKLIKYFNKTIFIKSNRKLRLKRYRLNGGNKKLFSLLDSRQIKDVKKMTLCDHVVVNNQSLSILKKKLLIIISKYE